jgi:hypothetical protein
MTNVGSFDRMARFILGAILLSVTFIPGIADQFLVMGAWRWAIPIAGCVMLLTAAIRWCPAYSLFGWRS